jgi:SAM-dependent methyltransferase
MINVLHIGSGQKFDDRFHQQPNIRYITNDLAALNGISWPADLNNFSWPFPDSYFDRVLAIDIIEHLDNPKLVFEEIHRVLKKSGEVEIQVPHFGSLAHASDMTHRHGFTPLSFGFFLEGHPYCKAQPWYTSARFQCISFALDDAEQASMSIPIEWRTAMLHHQVVGNLQLKLKKL